MKTILYILIASAFVLSSIARTIDLQFDHFEDGSGRITYCLPFSTCK